MAYYPGQPFGALRYYKTAQNEKVSQSAVSVVCVQRRQYFQHQFKTSYRENRLMRLWVFRDRTNTARDLTNRLIDTIDMGVSDQSVRNKLHEAHMRSKKAVKVPKLTDEQRAAHRKYACSPLFSQIKISTCRCCGCRQGEMYLDETVQEILRFDGGFVMV